CEECIFFREVIVEPAQEVMLVCDLVGHLRHLSGTRGSVEVHGRQRVYSERAGNGIVGGWIGRTSKCRGAVSGVWNTRNPGLRQQLPDAFVVREEEHLVFLDWPAHTATGLKTAKRDRFGIEKAARVEHAVAEISVSGAM